MTLKIDYLPLSGLKSALVNPKAHAEQALTDSLGRFGYVEPIVRDDRTGRLVAGHGRFSALQTAKAAGVDAPEGVKVEGDEWLVPVLTGWASKNDNEASAYLVASNKLSELGGWDDRELSKLVLQVRDAERGLEGTGLTEDRIEQLTRSAAALDEAEAKLAAQESKPADYVVLTYRGVRIETTKSEIAACEKVVEAYAEKTGATFGLIAKLLQSK